MALNFLNDAYFAGKVGIGTDSPSRGILVVKGDFETVSSGNGQLAVISGVLGSNPSAADVGGQMVFGGPISSSDSNRTFGLVGGYKENNTSGDRSGYLSFGTRQNTGARDIFERMRITSGGNVGIGVTGPTAKLQVYDDRDITNNSTNKGIRLQESTGDWLLSLGVSNVTNTGFAIRDNVTSTYPFVIRETTGNVGIGTTSPDTKLNVTDGGTQVAISNTYLAHLQSASNCGLAITAGASSNNYIAFGDSDDYDEGIINYNNSTRSFAFRTAGGILDDLVITSTGKVGIGTTSPSTFLQVSGQGNRAGGNIQMGLSSQGANKWSYLTGTHYNSTTEPEGFALIGGYSDINENRVVIGGDIWETNPATSIHFWTHSSSTHAQGGTQRMVIDTAGNVGIGTASPGAKLEINNGSTQTELRISVTGDTGYSTINFSDASDINPGQIYYHHQQNLMNFRTNDNDRMVINSSGNVGIGTTGPGAKLHVRKDQAAETKAIIQNNNGAGAGVRLELSVGDPASDDPVVSFNIGNGGADWSMGVDNNDADKFKISGGTDSHNPNLAAGNKLTIDTSGNVGIGVTGPTKTLHVVSAAEAALFQGTATWGTGIQIDATATGGRNFQIQSSADAAGEGGGKFLIVDRDATGGPTRIAIDSTGNVGIGVTDPEKKLEVKSDTTYDGIMLDVLSNPEITFRDRGNSDTLVGTGRHALDGFHIDTYSGNAFFIKGSNRYVGIGTTSPTSLLEISKQLSAASTIDYPYTISSRDDGNSINQVGGEGVGIKFRIAGNAGTTPGNSLVGASIAAIRESSSDTDSSTGLGFFVTQNDETLDEAIRIDHDGNVGIGTTSPGEKLEINTAAQSAIMLRARYNANYYTDYGSNQINFTGSNQSFGIKNNGSFAMFINAGSNVGIGVTGPQSKLQVAGGIQMADDTATASASKVGTMRYRTATDEPVPVTGIDFVTNGNFATDSDWTKSSNATISGGQATLTANSAAQYLIQGSLWPANTLSGQKVLLTYIIVSNSLNAGDFRIGGYTGASAFTLTGLPTAVGTHSVTLDVRTSAGDDNAIDLYITSAATSGALVIDNVSVMEVTEEDASYADMCMQTGASTYEWVNIVRNTY